MNSNDAFISIRHDIETLRNLGCLVAKNAKDDTQIAKDGVLIAEMADSALEKLIAIFGKGTK